MNLNQTLQTASSIVSQARTRLLSIARTDLQITKKEDNSFVTRADKETELFIRDQLSQAFPDHSIHGEEFPTIDRNSPYRWIIDPIDGTHSFRHNIPLFGTMLCLLHDSIPIVSIIDLPGFDKLYAAAKGQGTTCNGNLVRLTDLQQDEMVVDEVIATGERLQFDDCGLAHQFDKLMKSHRHVRTYCDCFGHTMAAEGWVGAMVDFNIRIWDCMASVLIVEEAGGKAVCVGQRQDGKELRYDWVFGKPSVVDWVCDLLELEKIGL